jgi:nicotinate-nucleotide adenylyltransferase
MVGAISVISCNRHTYTSIWETFMTRYAVYGGSFDPIHTGHLSVVERAIAQGYDVLVVPAYRHAFGKQSSPFEHRVQMCQLALETSPYHMQARVCAVERTMAQKTAAPIYTYDVLCVLRLRLQSAPCLLTGPDIAAEWARWYQHEAIDRKFGRISFPMTRAVRSSTIRQQLHAGVALDDLYGELPEAVRLYIEAHVLYRDDCTPPAT